MVEMIKGLTQQEYMRKYAIAHAEEIRARRAKEREQKREEYRRRWRKNFVVQSKRFPEKILARTLLRQAIKRGEIKRGPCAYEVFECNGRIEGHHHDYNKPLEVKWLCSHHHRLYERGLLS